MDTKVISPGLIILALSAAAVAAPLKPRVELAKPVTVTQPTHPHRLVAKFRDHLKVRAADGLLVSLAGADLAEVTAVGVTQDVSYSQLIRLPQARLDFLEQRAAQASGTAQPDLAGMVVVEAASDRLQAIADHLLALDAVEFVSFEEITPLPPCNDVSPSTPDYVAMQSYHQQNPGINMAGAWQLGAARGAGVKLADCEYGYVASHEGLCGVIMEPGQTIADGVFANGWEQHGTAVLGEMVAVDAAYGCTGLVPEAEPYFFTEWSQEQGFRRTTAIANAIATVDAGDVVVLEMQATGPGGDFGPAELSSSVWTLVKNGTDAGVVVVAAAGNGNQDLDSAPYQEYMSRGDSGAIIVGAGTASLSHNKLSFSTYGSRVNVQAWGQSVFTLGYGWFISIGGDPNQRYTDAFSGTSSATPLVAAACVALQSLSLEAFGVPQTPLQLRQLLIDTGIPQGSGGHIGPFPDVLAAATDMLSLSVPGVYPTIQAAIDAADDGQRVIVAPGTYAESLDFHGKAISVRSAAGPEQTVLEGGAGPGSIVQFVSGEGPGSVLRGFTITGGDAPSGGAMLVDGSSPTILNCIFEFNLASGDGGALRHQGGAAAKLVNCVFDGNAAVGDGGAISNAAGSDINVVNCTFHANTALGTGGALHNAGGSPQVANTILWGNTPDQIADTTGAATTVSHGIVQGGWPGTNLAQLPTFVDAAAGDFRLQPGSPCIDAGDNLAIPLDTDDLDLDGNTTEAVPDDLLGERRFRNDSGITDTGVPGNGTTAVVDIGATEFQGTTDSCPYGADLDNDVDATDFLILLQLWGTDPGGPPDGNQDGIIDTADLLGMLAHWGPC